MRPWIGEGTQVWPKGRTQWQLYLLPTKEHRDLARLVSRCDPVVRARRQRRVLAPVPRRWLHATLQPLPGAASEWPDEQLAALRAALRDHLADFGQLHAEFGPPLCGSSGAMLDATTDGHLGARWRDLHHRIRSAAAGVLDPGDVLPPPSWPPHIALAYCHRRADSGPVSSQLRRLRPAYAAAVFDSVALVEVVQDSARHQYRWRRAIPIPLTRSDVNVRPFASSSTGGLP